MRSDFSSRTILVLASSFLMLASSCSMFGSKSDSGSETADSAAKKDADNIATDTGMDGAAAASSPDGAAPDGSRPLNANEKSLFDRVGGKETLVKFSGKFVDAMASNPKLLANPKVAEAMKKDQSKHKAGLAEYLCQVSGGPCKYNGPSIKEAHQSLGVTADEWKVMGGLFIKTLREMNVGKNERRELANLASMSKPDIVTGQ